MSQTEQNIWHTKKSSAVLKELDSREHGLTQEEVDERLRVHGFNKLPQGKVDGVFLLFLRQFQSPLIYLLLIAAGIIYFMGDPVDAAIVFANSL